MKKALSIICFICFFNQTQAQIIQNGTYRIFNTVHSEVVTTGNNAPFEAQMSAQNTSDDYQKWTFIHQGDDVYKILNVGSNTYLGINDGWCGQFGDVRAGFSENDANVEFKIVTTDTFGAFAFQIAFTTCNFGSVNDPIKAFDIQDGASGAQIQTFDFISNSLNQQFRLKSIAPIIEDDTYFMFSDVHGEVLASPTDVNQNDAGNATINNLFATNLDSNDNYQSFDFIYQYTNTNGEVYKIKNIGTNLFVGLKDNWCGNDAEVIARFNENDTNVEFIISKDTNSNRFLFTNNFGPNCNEFSPAGITSYFDLSGGESGAKIRTFNDTGFNQQFRLISKTSTFIYDNLWSPSIPTGVGGENIIIENGTFTTNSDVNFNSIIVAMDGVMEISPTDVLSVTELIFNKGSFVFKSNASGAAQLANATGLNISGNVTVERFIPKRSDNVKAFRFLASSVGEVNISDSWQTNTHITGAMGTVGETSVNGFDQTTTGSPSMFTYNHNLETQNANNAWTSIGSTYEDIVVGRPYRLFVRGDRSVDISINESPATDVTLSATGKLHIGPFDVVTSNFSENFTFIGNPYQAVVNLNDLTYGDDVNNNYAYYWDPTQGNAGAFVTIGLLDEFPLPGSSNADNFLRPGQAVFMRNKNTGSDFSIQFNESDKNTSGSQLQVFSQNPNLSFVNIRLYKTEKFNNNQKEDDAIGIRFLENGDNGLDVLDALKMANSGANFAMINSNRPLSIQTRAMPQSQEQIPLFINNVTSDNYTFRFESNNLPTNIKLFLHDNYLQSVTEINSDIFTYSYDVDTSNESSATTRFLLVFEEIILSNNEINSVDCIDLYPNPTTDVLFLKSDLFQNKNVKVKIVNALGSIIQNIDFKATKKNILTINTNQILHGIYFITVDFEDGSQFTERFIKY